MRPGISSAGVVNQLEYAGAILQNKMWQREASKHAFRVCFCIHQGILIFAIGNSSLPAFNNLPYIYGGGGTGNSKAVLHCVVSTPGDGDFYCLHAANYWLQ